MSLSHCPLPEKVISHLPQFLSASIDIIIVPCCNTLFVHLRAHDIHIAVASFVTIAEVVRYNPKSIGPLFISMYASYRTYRKQGESGTLKRNSKDSTIRTTDIPQVHWSSDKVPTSYFVNQPISSHPHNTSGTGRTSKNHQRGHTRARAWLEEHFGNAA